MPRRQGNRAQLGAADGRGHEAAESVVAPYYPTTSTLAAKRGRFHNEDLAVTKLEDRTWGFAHYVCLWVALSLNIPTYLLATSFLQGGMTYSEASLVVVLGSVAITPPMILNGQAGARYGIPFPVLARASFGMKGANIAALMRAIVACGWFGIQAWVGGQALYKLALLCVPSFSDLPGHGGQVLLFLVFWALNLLAVWRGIEGLKYVLAVKGVVLSLVVLALLFWALIITGARVDYSMAPAASIVRPSLNYYGASVTAVVGTWATLALNISDFTRYAKSTRVEVVGQLLGLPVAVAGFTLLCIFVTAATQKLYGSPVYDPVVLVSRLESRVLQAVGHLLIALATLATNLAANLVAPANDLANLCPRWINFRAGALLTGLLSFASCPWLLMSSADNYIYDWLVAYGSLLGPLLGILLADYYVVRGQVLDISHLYSDRPGAIYWYHRGYNPCALLALMVGIAPNLPGFLTSVKVLPDPAGGALLSVYSYSWFIGLLLASVVYVIGMRVAWGRTGVPLGSLSPLMEEEGKEEGLTVLNHHDLEGGGYIGHHK